jgi:hypothetical protein
VGRLVTSPARRGDLLLIVQDSAGDCAGGAPLPAGQTLLGCRMADRPLHWLPRQLPARLTKSGARALLVRVTA